MTIRQKLEALDAAIHKYLPKTLAPMLRPEFAGDDASIAEIESALGRDISTDYRALASWSDGAEPPDKSHPLWHVFGGWDLMAPQDFAETIDDYPDWPNHLEPFLMSQCGGELWCIDRERRDSVVLLEHDGGAKYRVTKLLYPSLASFVEAWTKAIRTVTDDSVDEEARELWLDLEHPKGYPKRLTK
ncbi:MAG: SMI1/KNR4 family protein [Polyangiaceae bacterium]